MRKVWKTELTMRLANSLAVSKVKLPLLLMIPLVIAGCSSRAPEAEVVVTTEYQKQNIPIQERPKVVQFPPVDWFIITQENLEEKLVEIDSKTGNVVVFAITPKGYENLALGIADLRRYVKDQQAIIGYYEEALEEPEVENVETSE